jgi:hypothetical protein
MAISLASLRRSSTLQPPRILMHGVAGVGKSTFAAKADSPVFVMTEDGLGICHATGKLQVADSADLHLIPITIQVTVKPPKNGYGERNAIRYLVPAPGSVPARTAAPQASSDASAAAPVRNTSAPWNKKA